MAEVTAEWAGLTAFTVDIAFCCEHIDMLTNEEPPYLDFGVVSRVREAS